MTSLNSSNPLSGVVGETMKAGRELDARIAAEVFGYPVKWLATALSPNQPHYANRAEGSGWLWCKPYSSDIAAAWLVVEEMRAENRMLSLNYLPESACWNCHIYAPKFATGVGEEADADTAPLAICLAALKALGVSHV